MERVFLSWVKSMLRERPHWLIPGVGGVGLYEKCIDLDAARGEPLQEARKYGAMAAALFECTRLGLPLSFPALQYASIGHVNIQPWYWAFAGASYFAFTVVFSEMGKRIDSRTLDVKIENNSTSA